MTVNQPARNEWNENEENNCDFSLDGTLDERTLLLCFFGGTISTVVPAGDDDDGGLEL